MLRVAENLKHHAWGPEGAQTLRYALVGVVNTLLSLALLKVLYHTGWPYPLYTTLAYVIMILVSFELNRRFTFRARATSHRQTGMWLTRFFVLHTANLVLIQLTQAMLIEGLHTPELPAILAAMVLGTVTGFLGSRFWVYPSTAPTR